CAYALVLLRRGVPALEGALVTVSLGAAALTLGVALTVRRLRRGAGLVTALARSSGLTRLAFVRQQMDVLGAAEEEAAGLIADPPAVGLAVGLVVRLREVAWIVPGILYLMMRAPGLTRGALTTPPDPCTRAPEPPPARAVPMRGGGGGG